ncbi:GNAT family N-acetyltransferase [Ruania halotolerans]|uniref:GNAT family N-acetyltransferase n=1 Tax=Ruania halotolerans TaxID=2897773 RepID=UPI001E3D419C|nr:GNAT family N-acetyltransferase [Ruania halotolerans]UFU07471.1 GNAT family N-acetyltransferase [Ruania halotolerans]
MDGRERGQALQMRSARTDEASALSALALRSKGHWGYPQDFLDACREELTITPERCDSEVVTVALLEDRIAGFYTVDGSPPEGELGALFVDLDLIGSGVGGSLLRHALASAASRGFRRLVLDADPGAEAFYVRYGAERIGEVPSGSVPGRMLPHMRFDLTRPVRD